MDKSIAFVVVVLLAVTNVQGAVRYCFSCRSRGDLGSCKDPFKFNSTLTETVKGVSTVPCSSGWCAKRIEGGSTFKDDDYGIATQRQCLPYGPSDNEERCAHTEWNHKKVYMCFCQGDLCNDASSLSSAFIYIIAMFSTVMFCR